MVETLKEKRKRSLTFQSLVSLLSDLCCSVCVVQDMSVEVVAYVVQVISSGYSWAIHVWSF
jgi:hypothetical protein